MKPWLFVAASAAVLLSSPAFAWGKTGHRVIAAIADKELSGLARARISQILEPGESLDEASNWPDEMRAAPGEFWQKQATPWHYVTLNGPTYDHAPPEGDAFEALGRFRRTLQDPKASREDKRIALRFIIHLVGDLHQPLHVGKCCDKGGNDVKVTFFGKPTNLHSVWDSLLIDDEQLSFSELAAKLERHISNEDVVRWWDPDPLHWINESAAIRDSVYPTAADLPKGAKAGPDGGAVPDLSYTYVFKFRPTVEQRLSQGGIRLAAYLNAIFAQPQQTAGR